MNRISNSISLLAFVSLLVVTAAAQAAERDVPNGKASNLDTTAIEQAMGKSGELKGDVYKVSMPRKDLSVTVKGVKLKPGLALGSWVAFTEAGGKAVMDGDLVLTEDEVAPVFDKLRRGGIEVTAFCTTI